MMFFSQAKQGLRVKKDGEDCLRGPFRGRANVLVP